MQQPPPVLLAQHHLHQRLLPLPTLLIRKRDLELLQRDIHQRQLGLRVVLEPLGALRRRLVVRASQARASEMGDPPQDLVLGPPAERELARLVVLEVDDGELAEEG